MATARSISYRAYLRGAVWAQKRAAAIARAGYRCQVCNRSGRLEVHHRDYSVCGHESEADLLVLCQECHALFHKHRRLA